MFPIRRVFLYKVKRVRFVQTCELLFHQSRGVVDFRVLTNRNELSANHENTHRPKQYKYSRAYETEEKGALQQPSKIENIVILWAK